MVISSKLALVRNLPIELGEIRLMYQIEVGDGMG